jgi:hypothetical protein
MLVPRSTVSIPKTKRLKYGMNETCKDSLPIGQQSQINFKWRIARLTFILMSTLVSSLCKPNGFFNRLENMFKVPLERTYGTKPKSALQDLKALSTEWSCLITRQPGFAMFSPESMNFKTERNRKSNGELVGYCNWKTMLQEDVSDANRDGTGPGTIYSNSARSEEFLPSGFDDSRLLRTRIPH